MEFKKGLTIKPKVINSVGEVIFTDGTNDVVANQRVCEAYGYRYNAGKGTCEAFIYNTKINRTSNNVHNIIKGTNNTTNSGTENTLVLGKNNTTFGDNKNSIVIGENNQIASKINNAAVISGSYSEATNQGELVLGGGTLQDTGVVGMAQTSFIQQAGNTASSTETFLLIQNLPLTYIQKVANSVIGFEANVIGVNTGIGEGSAGQYGYVQITGAVKFGNGLESAYYQTSTHIVTSGHSGMNISAEMKDVTATSFGIAVTGLEETYIQWTADIKLWRNKIQQTF
tara:strand:+ start:344 stop:1195 length:852 start_codon:yes stop_codon:yes gene_type:complete